MHAWQHLQHFFSWLFHSQESWAGFIGAIVGAFVGGFMTIIAAIWAQKQAAKDQRQSHQETERRAVNGILRSIAAELQVLKCDTFHPLQNAQNKRYETQEMLRQEMLREKNMTQKYLPSATVVPSEQNYFIVFESNAAALGGINDEKLREEIIRVYGRAKGLVDLLNAHSRNFKLWCGLQEGTHEKPLPAGILEESETAIRTRLNAIEPELDELLVKIEKYLDSQRA